MLRGGQARAIPLGGGWRYDAGVGDRDYHPGGAHEYYSHEQAGAPACQEPAGPSASIRLGLVAHPYRAGT